MSIRSDKSTGYRYPGELKERAIRMAILGHSSSNWDVID